MLSRPRPRRARRPAPKDTTRVEVPEFIPPQLATLVSKPSQGEQWLHEIKFDGYRVAARIVSGNVRMLTRHGLDWTAKFTPIADAIAGLKVRSAYIDGEVAVVDSGDVTDFAGLREALSEGKVNRLAYYAFDLLHLNGKDWRPLPLVDRKIALRHLLSRAGVDPWVQYSAHVTGQGSGFFKEACRAELEGIVSKRADSPYRSGRGGDWLKTKCVQRQEFVIGGWRPSAAPGREFGSILVGYYDHGQLRYAGKVGTGFPPAEGRNMVARLRKHERRQSPFDEPVPRPDAREARWVDPVNVAEVEFTAWTRDGRVRHPSFKGFREDKNPREVKRERPAGEAA
jgi:bifunctional non-homologous end joining protein LigD